MGNISSKVMNNNLICTVVPSKMKDKMRDSMIDSGSGFKSRRVNFNLRVHTNQMIYSLLICELFEFMTMKEVMEMQLLSKHVYNVVVPLYCENKTGQRENLHAFRLPESVQKDAMLLFQKDLEGSFYKISSRKNELKWDKAPQQLKLKKETLFKIGQDKLFNFTEDWSKIVHLESSKFFVCGGSTKDDQSHISFSNKAYIIDVQTGDVSQIQNMIKQRQAHGVSRVGQFIYCCGGLNQGWCALSHCERFDLLRKRWTEDVPPMNNRKFSMTMIKVDKTWLYAFGGVSQNYHRDSRNLVVERLNTKLLYDTSDPTLQLMNQQQQKWEELCLPSDVYTSCCQQGIIQISARHSTSGTQDDPHQREFLIFGGVDQDYTKQTFIFAENVDDFSKSCLKKAKKNQCLEFVDKFYYQQSFKVSKLPADITSTLKTHYSENLMVYPGRKGLHIYDIAHQKWLLHSKLPGHQYQDIYFKVSGTIEQEGEDMDDSSDLEEIIIIEDQQQQQQQQQQQEQNQIDSQSEDEDIQIKENDGKPGNNMEEYDWFNRSSALTKGSTASITADGPFGFNPSSNDVDVIGDASQDWLPVKEQEIGGVEEDQEMPEPQDYEAQQRKNVVNYLKQLEELNFRLNYCSKVE